MGPTVLVVDDEPMVREVVARYLELDGMQVFEVGDGSSAQEWLNNNQPDLVVLDVMLPQIDGLSILRRLRTVSSVPVILLTARAEESDRVVGLELGADDYVVKPFSPRELAARVRSVLRRTGIARAEQAGSELNSRLEFDGLVVNCVSREVLLNGSAISLTPKEFDLLALLARSPRQVFSRAQLLEQVWSSSPDYQDPATVTVHVGRIRQKLEIDPELPRWIITIRSVGYRFEP